MKTRRNILIALALLALGLLLATPSLSRSLHTYHERQCLKKGWSRLTLSVEGQARKVLWKAPAGPWKGAIVILHGGGGACSDFGSTVEIGQPMVEFSSLALSRGFAVVCPDSGDSLARDAQGRGYGKRWDCFPVDHRDNVDLPFLRQVLGQTVPALRPSGSGKGVFLTGISNGGYMAILTATHFPEQTLREHLWRVEYNEPMLDFFETTTGDPDPPHSGASLSFPNFA